MAVTPRKLILSSAIAAVLAVLAACGGPSNNLSDPAPTDTATTCGSSNGICVKGQFIDEPVVGLNYRCDNIVNVTDANGYFECPNNSAVEFFLKAEGGKREISLGSTLVKPVLLTVKGKTEPQLLWVSPLQIVPGGETLDDFSGADVATARVSNILRLLQTLGTLQNGRLVISNDDKKAVEELEDNIGAGAFANTLDLEAKLAKVLTKLGRSLRGKDVAINRFLKTYPIVYAGLYQTPAVNFSFGEVGDVIETGMVGQYGATQVLSGPNGVENRVSEKAVEAILMLLDREGKSIGLGLEWLARIQTNPTESNVPRSIIEVATRSEPKDLTPASSNLGFTLSGKIKSDFKFLVGNIDGAPTGASIEIIQGLNQHGYVSGHPFLYRRLFGLTESQEVPPLALGKWNRHDSVDGGVTYQGSVNLERYRRFDTVLDPAGWRTKDNVAAGEQPIFPLHVTMTFRTDNKNPLNGCDAVKGCTVGTAGITILENGNIITDINNDCGAVNTELKDPSGQQEYRLGAIAAIFQIDDKPAYYISPVMMFTKIPGWEKFYGTVVGAADRKARIDISRVTQGHIEMLSFEADSADPKKLSTALASWLNYPRSYRSLQSTPVDRTADGVNAKGEIDIGLQNCPAVP